QIGDGIYLMLPFVKLHERMKYGGYASNTAMDGFSKSNAAVLVVHSFDDEVVPAEYGYEIYYEKYKDDSRFRFLSFENEGHNYFNDDTYRDAFNAEFDKWIETLDYDYTTEENKERFSEDKAEYIDRNLDREKWCSSLDLELFGEFVDFADFKRNI
ncbi:MAG: alpha/beta hydrolase, partial [Lachnospiraceae bacterium]|nr:alpha/beta hydrolase [Lachnospiraceae bacterium]